MNNNKGSALITVIFVTSFLAIASYGLWYKTSLFLDIVVKRENFYKHFYFTETIMDYAKKNVTKNFEKLTGLLKSKTSIKNSLNYLIEVIDNNVNTDFQNQYDAEMILKINTEENLKKDKKLNSIVLYVNLLDKNNSKKLCSLSCVIKKKNTNGKTKKQFIVKNYRIGSTI